MERLTQLPLGTRVVVRYRIEDGLTDALGFLTTVDEHSVTVATRGGDVVVRLEAIQAAKPVPPAPEARRGRGTKGDAALQ
ncbi:ferrous iron transport protein A [Paenarthrobacter sp. Z7-10]|uniref:putative acetyltransferase n=1 Tax=Paenarthrobacter sp. Z7-10 TaxID=2787635 RepID=UPI0022A90130|nr:hypothetical protein [Paenarthrobacter sp. Z7-10]MCZ2403989.1 ferrous iron transport protein A [Paenarthrobacter sp. Z7-10]